MDTEAGVGRYRKKPVEIEAIQWTGKNLPEVQAFAGSVNFDELSPGDRFVSDDPEATAQVYDKLHSTWIPVYDGDYIIQGIDGETYPCRESVFLRTYEPAA